MNASVTIKQNHEMGIKGLSQIIREYAPMCTLKLKQEDLRNKRIGIDASIWVNQFAHKGINEENGTICNETMFQNFMARLTTLTNMGATPLVVFDGTPPICKERELQQMARKRQRWRGDIHVPQKRHLEYCGMDYKKGV